MSNILLMFPLGVFVVLAIMGIIVAGYRIQTAATSQRRKWAIMGLAGSLVTLVVSAVTLYYLLASENFSWALLVGSYFALVSNHFTLLRRSAPKYWQ